MCGEPSGQFDDAWVDLGPAALQARRWDTFHNLSSALLGGDEVCECDKLAGVENRWFANGNARLAYLASTPNLFTNGVVPSVAWRRGFRAVRSAAACLCRPPNGCTRTRTLPPGCVSREGVCAHAAAERVSGWAELHDARLRHVV